jgi:hypothetical protein
MPTERGVALRPEKPGIDCTGAECNSAPRHITLRHRTLRLDTPGTLWLLLHHARRGRIPSAASQCPAHHRMAQLLHQPNPSPKSPPPPHRHGPLPHRPRHLGTGIHRQPAMKSALTVIAKALLAIAAPWVGAFVCIRLVIICTGNDNYSWAFLLFSPGLLLASAICLAVVLTKHFSPKWPK